jgi:hypothetical protein
MFETIVAWCLGLVSTLSIGVFGWAFTINSKVNVQGKEIEANEKLGVVRQADLKELINEKFDGVNDRLARIERAMNGKLGVH